MTLFDLGWNDSFAGNAGLKGDSIIGRVAFESRGHYTILTERGTVPAVLTGKMRREARSSIDLPVVGDWVALSGASSEEESGMSGSRLITMLMPRKTCFVRKAAGQETLPQPAAANVDFVFVVCGLDGNYNVRRVLRYVAATWESGAVPVVVLTKADVHPEPDTAVAETEAAVPGVEVLAVSARTGRGLDSLLRFLAPRKTVALLGSSGAGKSTLVNTFAGADIRKTTAVREDDSRGRHTTSARQLICLPNGAFVIDTPGMRELALWTGEEGLGDGFPDIEELAASCRFSDCSHETEPGCAVLAALADGAIDADRYESYRKLRREAAYLEQRKDERAALVEKRKWKVICKAARNFSKPGRG
jgi:ribosome biogenesis GTPase / thiamine phosphate phosphatase